MTSIFVNVTNSYKRPESDAREEMMKLAQFAKHHVPQVRTKTRLRRFYHRFFAQEHEKDAPKYVLRRVALLVQEGATAACVAVGTKNESKKCMHALARCMAKFTEHTKFRGQIVQEGGAKVRCSRDNLKKQTQMNAVQLLLRLALEGDEDTKPFAAQGLARIAISISPEIAFPGQRMYEVVRPLIDLLHMERSALQNYEALLALTNLAAHSDAVRKRILKGGTALSRIEEYWYMQEHAELKAAAAELLLNLCHCEQGRQAMYQV